MPNIYVLRGAPASGKGTVAPLFCESLPKPVSLIAQDVLRWDFHLIGRQVSEVEDWEHKFANDNTTILIEQYLKNGHYTVVIEGLYTWGIAQTSQGNVLELKQLAERYNCAFTSIVLRASKEILLERNAARPYAVPLDEFEMLYNNVYGIIDPSEIVVDSSNMNVDDTLKNLQELL